MDFTDLHALLHATYGEMMPLCAHMTGIAKGIAGLGALFYIALRIWSSLARAEPIDVFPLLRPFVLGFCIMFFPSVVLGTVNAVLSPVVQGTEKLVHVQQNDLQSLRDQRDKLEEEAYRRDKSRAYLVDDAAWDEKVQEMGFIGPEDAITLAGMYAERTAFNTKRWFVKKIYQALELVYNAASLVIDTLRTFILIVLSILGPIVFGIAECGTRSGHRHLASGVRALHTTLRRLIDIATVVADTTAGLDDPACDRRHAEEAHDANEEKDDVVPVAGVGDVARIL